MESVSLVGNCLNEEENYDYEKVKESIQKIV